jgi:hypothetical protein
VIGHVRPTLGIRTDRARFGQVLYVQYFRFRHLLPLPNYSGGIFGKTGWEKIRFGASLLRSVRVDSVEKLFGQQKIAVGLASDLLSLRSCESLNLFPRKRSVGGGPTFDFFNTIDLF